MGDIKWADAWQHLVYDHTPFRAVDDRDFQDLLREPSALERLFLTTPALGAYYNEWRTRPRASAGEAASVEAEPGTLAPLVGMRATDETIHAAGMQLQLMKNAFYSLRLDRYANAPDNRGWINLFRQWGRSPTFQAYVRELEHTFSRQFIEFYYHYLENWDSDIPVPHPWDVDSTAGAPQGQAYGGVTAEAVQRCMRVSETGKRGKGIYLDPGRVEAGPPRGVEEPLPIREEQHGTAGAESSPIGESRPAAADSSSDTD